MARFQGVDYYEVDSLLSEDERMVRDTADIEVARALLVRDTLNEISWGRASIVLGNALEYGTDRPVTMDALARFGEENTTYEYNPAYVPPRR